MLLQPLTEIALLKGAIVYFPAIPVLFLEQLKLILLKLVNGQVFLRKTYLNSTLREEEDDVLEGRAQVL